MCMALGFYTLDFALVATDTRNQHVQPDGSSVFTDRGRRLRLIRDGWLVSVGDGRVVHELFDRMEHVHGPEDLSPLLELAHSTVMAEHGPFPDVLGFAEHAGRHTTAALASRLPDAHRLDVARTEGGIEGHRGPGQVFAVGPPSLPLDRDEGLRLVRLAFGPLGPSPSVTAAVRQVAGLFAAVAELSEQVSTEVHVGLVVPGGDRFGRKMVRVEGPSAALAGASDDEVTGWLVQATSAEPRYSPGLLEDEAALTIPPGGIGFVYAMGETPEGKESPVSYDEVSMGQVITPGTITTAAIANHFGPNQAPKDDGADLIFHCQWTPDNATADTHDVFLTFHVDGSQVAAATIALDTPQPYERTVAGEGNLTGSHTAKITAQLRKKSDSLLTGSQVPSATLGFLGVNP